MYSACLCLTVPYTPSLCAGPHGLAMGLDDGMTDVMPVIARRKAFSSPTPSMSAVHSPWAWYTLVVVEGC